MSLRYYSMKLQAQIAELDKEDMLLIRQMFRQGWADVSLIRSWFGETETAALSRILSLSNQGVIENREDYWVLRPHLRFSSEKVLKNWGWL